MLSLEPKTIAEQIECLARLTNAPSTFVGQVKDLFSRKGISLHEDASPYLKALEEAFHREEVIRANASRARTNIEKMQTSFQRIGEEYSRQVRSSELGRRQPAAKAGTRAKSSKSSRVQVAIPGDHRTFVTPPQREDIPMVPGPEDLQ